ncbi:MAG TPA: c-type cytochrome [Sedimenticola sp.]|nr:c-type cytochrome [Sedimenticola sp.]
MCNIKIQAVTMGLLLGGSVMSGYTMAADGAALYKEKTCIACHGPEGREPVMNSYPKLAGQNEQYLVSQMQIIKSGVRNNSHTAAMKNIMHLVSAEEMTTIAKWLSGLKK